MFVPSTPLAPAWYMLLWSTHSRWTSTSTKAMNSFHPGPGSGPSGLMTYQFVEVLDRPSNAAVLSSLLVFAKKRQPFRKPLGAIQPLTITWILKNKQYTTNITKSFILGFIGCYRCYGCHAFILKNKNTCFFICYQGYDSHF